MLSKIELQTPAGENILDITSQVGAIVQESGVSEGICVLLAPHTTAGLALNSGLDPRTLQDISEEFGRLVPTRVDFKHTYDTPADAAGHIKSVLMGGDLSLIITRGGILLGHSQSVLFCEFDGPRKRKVWVRILADV
jgi:secondary thiamine-phosphate synthase enzyme